MRDVGPRIACVCPCTPHPASCILLLDFADYVADTKNTDFTAAAFPFFSRSLRWPSLLGGNLMNRTIFVLALAASSCAGCRAMGPYGGGGMGCGDACCEPCGPGPGCGDPCGPQCNGRGGSLDQCCAGGGDCAASAATAVRNAVATWRLRQLLEWRLLQRTVRRSGPWDGLWMLRFKLLRRWLSGCAVRLLGLRLVRLGSQRLSPSERLRHRPGMPLRHGMPAARTGTERLLLRPRLLLRVLLRSARARLLQLGRSALQLQPGSAGRSDGVSVLHAAWPARFPAG